MNRRSAKNSFTRRATYVTPATIRAGCWHRPSTGAVPDHRLVPIARGESDDRRAVATGRDGHARTVLRCGERDPLAVVGDAGRRVASLAPGHHGAVQRATEHAAGIRAERGDRPGRAGSADHLDGGLSVEDAEGEAAPDRVRVAAVVVGGRQRQRFCSAVGEPAHRHTLDHPDDRAVVVDAGRPGHRHALRAHAGRKLQLHHRARFAGRPQHRRVDVQRVAHRVAHHVTPGVDPQRHRPLVALGLGQHRELPVFMPGPGLVPVLLVGLEAGDHAVGVDRDGCAGRAGQRHRLAVVPRDRRGGVPGIQRADQVPAVVVDGVDAAAAAPRRHRIGLHHAAGRRRRGDRRRPGRRGPGPGFAMHLGTDVAGRAGDHQDRRGGTEDGASPVAPASRGDGLPHIGSGGRHVERHHQVVELSFLVHIDCSQFLRARVSRNTDRPREVWLLTVPAEQPSASATSSTGRSRRNRITRTARCRGGSARRAATSASRSSTAACGSPLSVSSEPAQGSSRTRDQARRFSSTNVCTSIRCT